MLDVFTADYLVCHLAELVRTSFIAATGNVNQLRLVGLDTIEVCIAVCICNAFLILMKNWSVSFRKLLKYLLDLLILTLKVFLCLSNTKLR